MSKSTIERLIYMANQIAANLATSDDPVSATAAHIERYWDPRMKAMIKAYTGNDLTPAAAGAIGRITA